MKYKSHKKIKVLILLFIFLIIPQNTSAFNATEIINLTNYSDIIPYIKTELIQFDVFEDNLVITDTIITNKSSLFSGQSFLKDNITFFMSISNNYSMPFLKTTKMEYGFGVYGWIFGNSYLIVREVESFSQLLGLKLYWRRILDGTNNLIIFYSRFYEEDNILNLIPKIDLISPSFYYDNYQNNSAISLKIAYINEKNNQSEIEYFWNQPNMPFYMLSEYQSLTTQYNDSTTYNLRNSFFVEFSMEIIESHITQTEDTFTLDLSKIDGFDQLLQDMLKINQDTILSGFIFNFYSSTINNISPSSLHWNYNHISPIIHTLSYLMPIDVSIIKDYEMNFVTFQQGDKSVVQLMPKKNQGFGNITEDLMEFALTQGTPLIQPFFFNFDNIVINYSTSTELPALRITSVPYQNTFDTNCTLNVTVSNLGNDTIRGIPLSQELMDAYGISNSPISYGTDKIIADYLKTSGNNVDILFRKDVPRFLAFSYGNLPVFQHIYNLSFSSDVFLPYSLSYSDLIMSKKSELMTELDIAESEVIDVASNYNKSRSVFNFNNSEILPHSQISMNITIDINSSLDYNLIKSFSFPFTRNGDTRYSITSNNVLLKTNTTESLYLDTVLDDSFSDHILNLSVCNTLSDRFENVTYQINQFSNYISGDFNTSISKFTRNDTIEPFTNYSYNFTFSPVVSKRMPAFELMLQNYSLFAQSVYINASYLPNSPNIPVVSVVNNCSDIIPMVSSKLCVNYTVTNIGSIELSEIGVSVLSCNVYNRTVTGVRNTLQFLPSEFLNITVTYVLEELISVTLPSVYLDIKCPHIGIYQTPILFGYNNLTVTRVVDKTNIKVGDIVVVTVYVKNQGTTILKDVIIDDSHIDFLFFHPISGFTTFVIDELLPNADYSYQYLMRAVNSGSGIILPSLIYIDDIIYTRAEIPPISCRISENYFTTITIVSVIAAILMETLKNNWDKLGQTRSASV